MLHIQAIVCGVLGRAMVSIDEDHEIVLHARDCTLNPQAARELAAALLQAAWKAENSEEIK